MLKPILSIYKNKPNLTHTLTDKNFPASGLTEAHTVQTLHLSYTNGNTLVSRIFYVSSSDPEYFMFPPDIQYKFIDLETGELMAQVFGFNNPDFDVYMDRFIENQRKFEVIDMEDNESVTNFQHGRYKRGKTGKWKKYRD